VGITRARQRAFITYAANRRIYGQYQNNIPSRFLSELPEDTIEKISFLNAFSYSATPKLYKAIPSTSMAASSASTADSSASASGFKLGQRIFHQKFGYGKITNISGDQLDIQFEKSGKKKVIDRYVEKA
jgi:DNA helicase-2/ATP-dependent DNA helicase PcrA